MPAATETTPPPAAPMSRPRARQTSRAVRVVDKLTTWGITTGGIMVIVAVIGILVYLVSVVVPLFRGAQITDAGSYRLLGPDRANQLWAVQLDEHQQHGFVLDRQGRLTVFDAPTGKIVSEQLLATGITAFARTLRGGHIALGFADGTVRLGRLRFTADGVEAALEDPLLVGKPGVAVHRLDYKPSDNRSVLTVLKANGELFWDEVTHRENILTGKITTKLTKHDLPYRPPAGRADLPDYLLQNTQGDQVYLAWRDGTVQRYDLRNITAPVIAETADFTPTPGIELTRLQFMFGDQSVIAGDSHGGVTAWFRVHRPESGTADGYRLVAAHKLDAHTAAVSAADMSTRDKCLVTGAVNGEIWLRHMTSRQVLGKVTTNRRGVREGETTPARPKVASDRVVAVHLTPKGDGLFALDADGRAYRWNVRNPHPETTWGTIFGKVWYEGYDHPDYTWQSSSANDDFEPKFSLVPLVFGTLKATIYSMLFAVPIALLGAIYTSQFLDPRLRAPIKSAIETMASLPSVVLGFIAALVLAPVVENWIVAVLLTFAFLPCVLLAGGFSWQWLPARWRARVPGGAQFLLVLALAPIAVWLAVVLSGPVETALFAGDFKAWLNARIGPYVQRNTLVVGFVMGFAVIPIIYTISEDALSSVPEHLRSASLACGATPWQTAIRVIVPVAMSGIFSACMIGLGRAVGETMIVVMAAGNTPLMDWNIFNGLRALSANIAVELPEAVKDSTLYRMLFLAALTLFVMTFLLNTAAEVIRQRFRKRAFQL